MKEFEIIINEVKKGMGFVFNSFYGMGKKFNIFGFFVMFMVNV